MTTLSGRTRILLHGGPMDGEEIALDPALENADAIVLQYGERSATYAHSASGSWNYDSRGLQAVNADPGINAIAFMERTTTGVVTRSLVDPSRQPYANIDPHTGLPMPETSVGWANFWQTVRRAPAELRKELVRDAQSRQKANRQALATPETAPVMRQLETIFRAATDVGVQYAKDRIRKMVTLGASNDEIIAEINRLTLEAKLHRLQKMLDNSLAYDQKTVDYAKPIG